MREFSRAARNTPDKQLAEWFNRADFMADELKTQILALSNPKAVRVNHAQPATRAMAARGEVELGLHRPNWSYGQPLAPHHFQQAARYHARNVTMAVRSAFAQPWGVVELKLDEQALASGHVAVERFAAIMPDGTPVVVSTAHGNARLPPRSFEAELRSQGSEVDVYVGLLYERADEANAGDGESARTRFTTTRTTMRDFSTGRDPVELEWLSANLRLMSEADPRENYSVLRIARLRRAESGRIEHAPNFAPPALRLSASPVLEQAVVSAAGALQAARTALLTQRGSNLPDIGRTLVLSTLGELQPALARLLASRSTSAIEAFDVLADTVGALAAYDHRGTAEIPTYQHDAPGPSFVALAMEAQRVLYWVGAPPYRQLPIAAHPTEEGVWSVRLTEPGLLGRPLLLVVSGAEPQTIHASIAHLIKVASADELSSIVARSTAGVPLVAEKKRVHGLPIPAHSALFRFDTRSDLWKRVLTTGSLAIAMPKTNPPGSLELSLFAENEKV